MIKNILFDVGNVLLDFDPERFLREAGYTKEQQEIAMRCVFTHPLWDQLDKGTVMEKEALQAFIKADPAQEALIREIAGRTKETLFPLSYADDWVKSLKAQGYPVYILSNYAGELYEKTKHLMTFLQYVDDALFSYQCKMIKPDREIYAYACEKFSILPQETVFIDDRAKNIAGAKEFGLQALQFTSYKETSARLRALLGK